jgi:hypothetical protein
LATAQRELEAEDLAAAALVVKEPEDVDGTSAGESSLALARVKVSGHMQVVKTRVETALQESQEKWEELKNKIAKDFSDGLAQHLNEAQNDLKQALDEASHKANTFVQTLAAAEVSIGKCTSLQEMQTKRKIVDTELKEFQSKQLSKFNRGFAALVRAMNTVKRKSDLACLASKVVVGPEAPPALFAIGKALIGMGVINQSSSSFEAKCGVRAALVAAGGGDPCGLIGSMAKTKKAMKDIRKHLQTNKTASVPVVDPPSTKRITKELKKIFDPCLFSTLALPEEEWSRKIYQPSYFGFSQGTHPST